MSESKCVFCAIIDETEPAFILRRWEGAVAFVPIGGLNEGHALIVPTRHFGRPDDDPEEYGRLSATAARYAGETQDDYNLMVNAGPYAGQTVFHLHVHLVPRHFKDGIRMPWDRCGCSANS